MLQIHHVWKSLTFRGHSDSLRCTCIIISAKKAYSNLIFFFSNDTFPLLTCLPPSPLFGHIAYKSQAILVSGLQKAWPPGKSVQDCPWHCLIRTLSTLSCASVFAHSASFDFFPSLIHPCTHSLSSFGQTLRTNAAYSFHLIACRGLSLILLFPNMSVFNCTRKWRFLLLCSICD